MQFPAKSAINHRMGLKHMLLDITNSLRSKISDPSVRLLHIPRLPAPLTIKRASITRVDRMSKYTYIVYCPAPVYVSVVFNKDFSFTESEYSSVHLRRCYELIYYDIKVD